MVRRSGAVARLPRNVLLLAAASFLADVSGEMLMAVLPFLLVAQGASGVGLGLVGGAADAIGHVLKPAAGAIADRTRKRRPLIVGGYLLAAVSRLGIAFSGAWQATLLFRSTDRAGKGLRTAPRDALLAESVPRRERGRAFGIHRTADTAGAFVGVGAALVMLALLSAEPSTVVLVGALVGLATVVPLAFVREMDGGPSADGKPAFEPASPQYVRFLVVAGIFALGNVSYLFYVLRAQEALGGAVPAVALYLAFNAVYAASAYPMGRLADRIGKARVLTIGFVLFAASAAFFIPPPDPVLAIAGFLAFGVAFASVDGVERAFAADLAGSATRGTRLGWFASVSGFASLAGGLVAGGLWDNVAPWAAFAWGATVPLLAAGMLVATPGLRRA